LFYNLGENIGGLSSHNRSFPVTLLTTGRNCRVNDLRTIVSSCVIIGKEGTQCGSVRCMQQNNGHLKFNDFVCSSNGRSTTSALTDGSWEITTAKGNYGIGK